MQRRWLAVINEGLERVDRRGALESGPGSGVERWFKRIESDFGADAAKDALVDALTRMWRDRESTMAAFESAANKYFDDSELRDIRTQWLADVWCPWRWEGSALVADPEPAEHDPDVAVNEARSAPHSSAEPANHPETHSDSADPSTAIVDGDDASTVLPDFELISMGELCAFADHHSGDAKRVADRWRDQQDGRGWSVRPIRAAEVRSAIAAIATAARETKHPEHKEHTR